MGKKETEEASEEARRGGLKRLDSVEALLADLNADDTPEIDEGSTNVYADLGRPGADEMQAKTTLVTKISQAITARQLSNDQAAAALGLTLAELGELLAAGFTDSFRHLHPDATGMYSWWSMRFRARERNAGWRIDYFLVSSRLADKIEKAEILMDVMGSDHCPVLLELNP